MRVHTFQNLRNWRRCIHILYQEDLIRNPMPLPSVGEIWTYIQGSIYDSYMTAWGPVPLLLNISFRVLVPAADIFPCVSYDGRLRSIERKSTLAGLMWSIKGREAINANSGIMESNTNWAMVHQTKSWSESAPKAYMFLGEMDLKRVGTVDRLNQFPKSHLT
jgi:hypothetical protein